MSGQDAEFTVDARDKYFNHLDTVEQFSFSVFQVSRNGAEAAAPPKMPFAIPSPLQYDQTLHKLRGTVRHVIVRGSVGLWTLKISRSY